MLTCRLSLKCFARKPPCSQLLQSKKPHNYSKSVDLRLCYLHKGGKSRWGGEANVQQPLPLAYTNFTGHQVLECKVIHYSPFVYIYTLLRISDMFAQLLFFEPLNPKLLFFLNGQLMMVLFRSIALKTKLNSSSNSRLNWKSVQF